MQSRRKNRIAAFKPIASLPVLKKQMPTSITIERTIFTHFSALLLVRTASPLGESFDGAEEYQAEPEVHEHTQVHLAQRMPGGRRQMWHHQKIHEVPCQNGNQGLNEIHSRF